jgi:hypothetical protein
MTARGYCCKVCAALLIFLNNVHAGKKVHEPVESSTVQSRENDWIKSLRFPPGTSLKDGDNIQLFVKTISQRREFDGGSWLAGKGYGSINDGVSFSGNGIFEAELILTTTSNCVPLLKQGIPHGRELVITGKGEFEPVNVRFGYIDIFKFDSVSNCALSEKK